MYILFLSSSTSLVSDPLMRWIVVKGTVHRTHCAGVALLEMVYKIALDINYLIAALTAL